LRIADFGFKRIRITEDGIAQFWNFDFEFSFSSGSTSSSSIDLVLENQGFVEYELKYIRGRGTRTRSI